MAGNGSELSMLLSEKLRTEARASSRLIVYRSPSGLPGHIRAEYVDTGVVAWTGHRDLAPPEIRAARDPLGVFTERDSSD